MDQDGECLGESASCDQILHEPESVTSGLHSRKAKGSGMES